MGRGSYSSADWAKLKESRGISQASNTNEIFRGNSFMDKYLPRYISVRESRDSEDSPNSTPIILAFDVTGSMGYLATEIAKNSLNKTVLELYEKKPISNPHVMCAAITSPLSKEWLQVTQFEADIRVAEQLLELVVGYGGNQFSYDSLIWYFAAKHTSIDSFEKRGKKGYLFTIGDEICGAGRGETLARSEIKTIFNDDIADVNYTIYEVYKMAAEKYEIFHIVTGRESSLSSWESFLPGRSTYISADNIEYLSELITSIMQISNGMEKAEVIKQWQNPARSVIERALSHINPYGALFGDFK